jgi:ADP-ribose pyrophosphatase YjhB (NUDIX family)
MGPSVGVGAVVVHEGRVLLVKRGKEPLRGRWVVPGGTVELGETLEEALVREILEETAIRVVPREVATVFDRIHRTEGRVVFHYVIVDFICDYVGGVAKAGSDAEAVAWAAPEELPRYDLPEKALEVVRDGFRRATILKQNIRHPGRTIDEGGGK